MDITNTRSEHPEASEYATEPTAPVSFGYHMSDGNIWCQNCAEDGEFCYSRHVYTRRKVTRDESNPAELCDACGDLVTP